MWKVAMSNILAKSNLAKLAVAALAAVWCTACITTEDPGKHAKKNKYQVYSVATQQTLAEPVYNPHRFVRPPETLPPRALPPQAAAVIMPVLQLELKNVKLNEAAQLIGKAVRYRSYCASPVANKVISINSVGTVDELAQQLAQLAGANQLVDHQNRELRFFAQSYVEPTF